MFNFIIYLSQLEIFIRIRMKKKYNQNISYYFAFIRFL